VAAKQLDVKKTHICPSGLCQVAGGAKQRETQARAGVVAGVCAMAVRMKVGPYIGFIVLVTVFGSAILGMLIRRKLPESHLSDETKSVVRLSMGVVGTLTAFVLSLLIATASSTFNTRNQEVTDITF
jgi:hypothetical protein